MLLVAHALVAPALGAVATHRPTSIRLHYAEVGTPAALAAATAPAPMLMLHGLCGSGANFRSWATALHDDCAANGRPRRIILVDLRNHGASDHAASMSVDAMAGDVRALLDAERIERAVLCGHSLGGKVAMALALSDPVRVERLIVLDMAPVAYELDDGSGWDESARLVDACARLDVGAVANKGDADRQLARVVGSPGLRNFMLMNLVRRSSGRGFAWRINIGGTQRALPEIARWNADDAGVSEPYGGNTLFVAGGKSRYLRSSHLLSISQHFSRFSITTVRNADHWIHADEPEALLLIVSNFLAV